MNILHLAAFTGNSGDCLSHAAFQARFRALVCAEAVFDEVNLRDFYRNNRLRSFDAAFAREVNRHDAFVLGGDLMFDLRWAYSATGTTLDFSKAFVDAIRVPVVLNGIGYAEPPVYADAAEKAEIFARFEAFVEHIAQKPNWLLALRNDGSYERIARRFGARLAGYFAVIPDNGFHFEAEKITPYAFEAPKRTVGICLANDAFSPVAGDEGRRETLNQAMASFVEDRIAEGCRVLLLPHMPKDLEAIHALYTLLGEKAFRYHIAIAPYNNLDKLSINALVSYYKACDCVLATRFHASVIPILCRVPAIGLAAQSLICPERITALYESLGLGAFSLAVPRTMDNVQARLRRQYEYTMASAHQFVALADAAMEQIAQARAAYFAQLQAFLASR